MFKIVYLLGLLSFGLLQAQGLDSLYNIKNINTETIKDSLTSVQQMEDRWKNELYNNSLYKLLKDSIVNQPTEPVHYPELPTDTLKKRLAILNAKTPFNIEYNESLESVIKSYLKHRKRSTETLIKRSQYFFPMFEEVLDSHNLPLEIKYLSVVESSLMPRAKSRVGATGLWQFMFSTGKYYGLEVSSYVDDRADPLRSTNAAAKYLQSLYRTFGDWELALAAYNAGPGNVAKAIRRSGGHQNYWNIRPFLPRETAGYVPAFLATLYIFEYAESHGLKMDQDQKRTIATDTVNIRKMVSLSHIAQFTDTKIELLKFLNPCYRLDIIPVLQNKAYSVRLPIDKIGHFIQNEDKIYAYAKAQFDAREKPLPQLVELNSKIRYKVKSGDYLGKIARKYKVKVSQIIKWNGLKTNDLKIDQRLIIYSKNPISN